MDYLIVEEFNRFWELFAVNERLYPHRRACTLNLWMKMPQEKRSAIIEEAKRRRADGDHRRYQAIFKEVYAQLKANLSSVASKEHLVRK